MNTPELSQAQLVRRLFALAWRYRLHCLQVLGIQLLLLTMGIGGLSLTGVGIDYIRHRIDGTPLVPGSTVLPLPEHWEYWQVLGLLAGLDVPTQGRIVLDVARYPELWREGTASFDLAFLHRWEVDLAAGSVRETPLDDRPIEFPRVDDRLCGLPNRFGYAVRNLSSRSQQATSLLQYDLERGTSEEHDFGPGCYPGEAVFAPDPSRRGERDGWLLALVYEAVEDRSRFVVLDAERFGGPPVATVHLPCRVPFGFHGNWMPGQA